jgi:succinyl-CoA synthetase beta subunit
MNVHEYQAKQLLAQHGVPVPNGRVAFTADEALAGAKELGGAMWVVKAQIHAGGRGKGGGVKIAKSLDEVHQLAGEILGMTLITPQTGPGGKEVGCVYIEAGCSIAKEFYLAFLVDRGTSRVSIISSTEGGMNIEEVAAETPEKIVTLSLDPLIGLRSYHVLRIGLGLGVSGAQIKSLRKLLESVYAAFNALDASLIEINPLVLNSAGEVIALDAKMNFDDNALYRQSAVEALRDETEEDPAELEAARHELNYIKLDGEIGCMVNGAGLAMATMDIIKLCGSEPANFLDVGGGATTERVTAAFKIIMSDANVKGILVNIFGGIMRCDVIAEGVVAAARETALSVPLVVRLEGTNVEQGKSILEASGLNIISANDLGDAAEKIVKAVKEAA